MEKPLLKNCRACGTEISRHTPFCRNCGHPQGWPLFVWLCAAFLLLLIAVYLAMIVYCGCNVERFRVFGPEQERGVEYYEELQSE